MNPGNATRGEECSSWNRPGQRDTVAGDSVPPGCGPDPLPAAVGLAQASVLAVGCQARCLQVPQLLAGLLQGHERESAPAVNPGLLHSLSQ